MNDRKLPPPSLKATLVKLAIALVVIAGLIAFTVLYSTGQWRTDDGRKIQTLG